MKVLSLFSGIGGFDIGLEKAGMETVFQCEIDKNCLNVLNRHWPAVPKWSDVTTLTGKYILEQTGGVDVVAWGSPCQDLSKAGKREGLAGSRSSLFLEGIRIINELRSESNGRYPRWSIWENVAGALTSNNGDDFEEVLSQMANIGACGLEWNILDAQRFGVPQRRRRLFLISCWDRGAIGKSRGKILDIPQSSTRGNRKGREEGQQASADHEKSPAESLCNAPELIYDWFEGNSTIPYVKVVRSGARDAEGNLPAEVWRPEQVGPTLNSFDTTEVRASVLVVQNQRIRRLIPLEYERLTGLSDNHTEYGGDGKKIPYSARFKMCGNAVVPNVSEWIGNQIMSLYKDEI